MILKETMEIFFPSVLSNTELQYYEIDIHTHYQDLVRMSSNDFLPLLKTLFCSKTDISSLITVI